MNTTSKAHLEVYPNNAPKSSLLNVKGACAVLNCGPSHFYSKILPALRRASNRHRRLAFRLGGQWRFPADLANLVEQMGGVE